MKCVPSVFRAVAVSLVVALAATLGATASDRAEAATVGYSRTEAADLYRAASYLGMPAERFQETGSAVVRFILTISGHSGRECEQSLSTVLPDSPTGPYEVAIRPSEHFDWVADHYCISAIQAARFGATLLTFLSGLDSQRNGRPYPRVEPPAAVPAPPRSEDLTTFAVIGDYGTGGESSRQVAARVVAEEPNFVITTGDNSYGDGLIDDHVGRPYNSFIGAYGGRYGAGSTENRFFPSIGNHDYSDGGGINAYLSYFTLPGPGALSSNTSRTERYYDFIEGPVHFFALNSDSREPDGRSSTSIQAQWLHTQLALSTSAWNVVYFHHAPRASGPGDGGVAEMDWPFGAWGADLVLSGHYHHYERIVDGIVYVVVGLSGQTARPTGTPVPGSQLRYSGDRGALFVTACAGGMNLRFTTLHAEVIDSALIGDSCL